MNGHGTLEAGFEAAFVTPETAWEQDESSNPEWEQSWETLEQQETHPAWEDTGFRASPTQEADPFLPLLGIAAAKALPFIAKAALPMAKKLLPMAKGMAKNVFRNVLRNVSGGGTRPQRRSVPRVIQKPSSQARARSASYAAQQRSRQTLHSRLDTIQQGVQQILAILKKGEQEAAQLEAEVFGAHEMNSELATHEIAHEAALTEVLSAEAAHTSSESEALALANTVLPITIRIMRGAQALRPVMPTLVQANHNLIRTLHRSGSAGRQLIRLNPAITRRTVGSLLSAQRQGMPLTPALARGIFAGQAARVLNTPRLTTQGLIRNTVIRQATVAPVQQRSRW